MKRILALLLYLLSLTSTGLSACTIFCGIDDQGQVWAGNNEDNSFSFINYIHVQPPTDSTMGYYTLSYEHQFNIEGGMNEAGLFFDYNALPRTIYKNYEEKKPFPGSATGMILYMMKHCRTVPEVIQLFETYQFTENFVAAQMHLADREGNFAIIAPDGTVLTKAPYQVSTNFNLAQGDKTGKFCWRYPIANRFLKKEKPNQASFTKICKATAQRGSNMTVYSTVQNLNTGDIWLYYNLNYERPHKMNLHDLLRKGKQSYLIGDFFPEDPSTQIFQQFKKNGAQAALEKLSALDLPTNVQDQYLQHLSNGLLIKNSDLTAYPFLEKWLEGQKKPGLHFIASQAFALYGLGRVEEAKSIIKEFYRANPSYSVCEVILNQFDGKFRPEANATFRLKGFPKASSVFVVDLPDNPMQYLLAKEENSWYGAFNLPPGSYNYRFKVDGKIILSEELPIYTINQIPATATHQIKVK